MRKPVLIIMAFLICCQCIGQEKEQQKSAIKYSAGIAYSQTWLLRWCYDEYSMESSSPFNWGVSPFFSMRKNRWEFGFSFSYFSFSRSEHYSETLFSQDKWQEAYLTSTVGFRVTGEHQSINVTPFLGVDLSYLINYEKYVTMDACTSHYNTAQLGARYADYNATWMPFGIDVLGGIDVSYPIAEHFEIGLSYCARFKVKNDIRGNHNPHFPYPVTSPLLYHSASIGVAYRFN